MQRYHIFLHTATNRYHLFQAIIGAEIINIHRCFPRISHLQEASDEKKPWNHFFSGYYGSITLDFSNHISIDLLRVRNEPIIREASQWGHKWTSFGFVSSTYSLHLQQSAFRDHPLQEALHKKVAKVTLVEDQSNFYAQGPLSIWLEDGSMLLLSVNPKLEVGGTTHYYPKNHSFLSKITLKDICPLKYNACFEGYVAQRDEVRHENYIEVCYPKSFPTSDAFSRIITNAYRSRLSKNPLDNLAFLVRLYNLLLDFQCAILDMKLGFNQKGELKLVAPMDVISNMVWGTNIGLILSLIRTIRSLITEEDYEKVMLEHGQVAFHKIPKKRLYDKDWDKRGASGLESRYLETEENMPTQEYIQLQDEGETVPFLINTGHFRSKLSKNPESNFKFLVELYEELIKCQIAIRNLRLGFNNKGELKLVKPKEEEIIDNYIWSTNIGFLQSLVDTASSISSE